MSRFRILCSLSNSLSSKISRKSYSALASGRNTSGGATVTNELKEKMSSNVNVIGEERDMSHWVPDPLTGFYKPANYIMGKEIDAVDLRAAMLKSKAATSAYNALIEEEVGVAELRHNATLELKKINVIFQ